MTPMEIASINKELETMRGDFDKLKLPSRMWDGIKSYLLHGILPGAFMLSVLENNLVATFRSADDENRKILSDYVRFFFHSVPGRAWGSDEHVKRWHGQGGYMGEGK